MIVWGRPASVFLTVLTVCPDRVLVRRPCRRAGCVCVCVSVVLYGDRCAGVGLGKEDENDRRERPQTDIEAGFKNHLAPSLMDFSADRLNTSKHANSSPLNSSLLLSKALRRSLLLISMSV